MNGDGSVAFRVRGKPVTQGSKWSPKGSHAVIDSSGKALTSWRQLVAESAMIAWRSKPITGPVTIHMIFKFQRPKGHFGSGKNAHMVLDRFKDERHTKLPDIDKVERAVLDALTGVIYEDDRQVCDVHKSKRWVESGQGLLLIADTDPKEGLDVYD